MMLVLGSSLSQVCKMFISFCELSVNLLNCIYWNSSFLFQMMEQLQIEQPRSQGLRTDVSMLQKLLQISFAVFRLDNAVHCLKSPAHVLERPKIFKKCVQLKKIIQLCHLNLRQSLVWNMNVYFYSYSFASDSTDSKSWHFLIRLVFRAAACLLC